MALGMPTAQANSRLDAAYGTVYVQLHTGDPGAAGTANVSAATSARAAATMAAASGASKAMTGTVGPWTNTGTSETITHVSLWTASSGGTFLRSVALTASRAWAAADSLSVTSLTISLGPVAA